MKLADCTPEAWEPTLDYGGLHHNLPWLPADYKLSKPHVMQLERRISFNFTTPQTLNRLRVEIERVLSEEIRKKAIQLNSNHVEHMKPRTHVIRDPEWNETAIYIQLTAYYGRICPNGCPE